MAKVKLPPAQVPCVDCFSKPRSSEKVVVVTCQHNKSIAVMPLRDGKPEGIWRIFTPVKPGDLIKILKEGGIS